MSTIAAYYLVVVTIGAKPDFIPFGTESSCKAAVELLVRVRRTSDYNFYCISAK